MRLIKKIAFGVMFTFSLIGLFVGGTLAHELSHEADFKKINLTNERMCILTFPNNLSSEMGFYEFSFDPKYLNQFNEINKYTEFKAYLIELLIIIIFVASFFIILGDEN